jgi:hypothetical protein
MGTKGSYPGGKAAKGGADHSPTSADVQNGWSYTSIPSIHLMVWFLVKNRDNFIFTLSSPVARHHRIKVKHDTLIILKNDEFELADSSSGHFYLMTHQVHNSSEVNLASNVADTGNSYHWIKPAGACILPLTSI